MKIILLSDFLIQIPDAQVILMFAENIFLFILLSAALCIMITTPIILFYAAIDNYFIWKKNSSLITNEICCENAKNHPMYVSTVCNLYKKSLSRLVGSALGLSAWNVCSLLYILYVFPDFKTGLINYFIFPFEVLESYTLTHMMGSLNQYNSSWLYMLFILGSTFIFYEIGKTTAPFLIRKKLPNIKKQISLV